MKLLKLWVLKKLVNWKWYRWAMDNIFPFIRFSTYYPEPDNKYYKQWGSLIKGGYKKLRAGHILLAIDGKNFSGKVIGQLTAGEDTENVFTHAAFCVHENRDRFEIAEMTHLDFTRSTFIDVCYKSTRVVILECEDFDGEYIKKMIDRTNTFKDVKYDDAFEMGIKELACSELVYEYDFERRLKVNLDPIFGVKPYISPMGLYKAKNVKVVWDSRYA